MPRLTTTFPTALTAVSIIATMLAYSQPVAAIEYPWCVQYTGDDGGGGRNCGFVSYEQCMMTARGAGGSCEQNLFYLDQQAKRQPSPRKPKHKPID